MVTNIVDRLKGYAEANDATGAYTEANCANDAIKEIKKLRTTMEKILLDIKFMTEEDVLPAHIFDDFIYQEALELMSPEFMKEFNND